MWEIDQLLRERESGRMFNEEAVCSEAASKCIHGKLSGGKKCDMNRCTSDWQPGKNCKEKPTEGFGKASEMY